LQKQHRDSCCCLHCTLLTNIACHTIRFSGKLIAQGHVTADEQKKRRFSPDSVDEDAADRSIHRDAIEIRSRTPARSVYNEQDDDDDQSLPIPSSLDYGNDDFGGGYDDDDDDTGFDAFIATQGNEARISGVSFAGDEDPFRDVSTNKTSSWLDAISSNQNLLASSAYEYFNSNAVLKLNNLWAGASHWKAKKKPVAPKKKTVAKKKASKKQEFVNFLEAPDMKDILIQPPRNKKSKACPLQLSSAVIKKLAQNDNLLPLNAGIGIEQLTKLFLRPNSMFQSNTAPAKSGRTVGFDMAGADAFDDGSFGGGGDDDGPGFAFADNDDDRDDFVIHELEDVRKVDKVKVGYATIAKKVDVKRLKHDLWIELETKFGDKTKSSDGGDDDDVNSVDDEEAQDASKMSVTFQQAVQNLESAKSQADITLPFYFICILHLANEKGLCLASKGLDDFEIYPDGSAPAV
jgi:condensin complex subunit 2